jgi:hypothetical protein
VEIVQHQLVEMPRVPLAHSPDEIRAVDSVFVQDEEKSDAAMGLMGLSLSAPWLVDLLAEQLLPSRGEEEDEHPHPRARPEEDNAE